MTIKFYVLTLVAFIVGTSQLSAQSGTYITIRDIETWSSATLAYKYSKKLKFGIGEQIRLKDNSSTIDQFFTEGFLQYKISKPIQVGTELRLIRQNDTKGKIQGFENHFRYAIYTTYKHDIKRLELKYRFQYQNKNEFGETASLSNTPIKKLRLKIGGTYKIKKWKFDPKLSGELFRTIGTDGNFSKIRGTIGTTYETKKAGDFDFFYRIEKELNEIYPKNTHVFGVNYQYTLKRKKK